MNVKKLISAVIATALTLTTVFVGGVAVKAEDEGLTLTSTAINSTNSTCTIADDTISIAGGQKAVFDVNVTDKVTYDITIPDITAANLGTMKYQVAIGYGSATVIKLYNDKVPAQPGWITFQPNTTSFVIENLGTTTMNFSSVKLDKKVFKASDSSIALPVSNYDASTSSLTVQRSGYVSNGENQIFFDYTNYGRIFPQNNDTLSYDINLEEAGDYYLIASVRSKDAPRYIVTLNGNQILAETVAKDSNDVRNDGSNTSYFQNVGKISLPSGNSTLGIRMQAYAYLEGYILVKADKLNEIAGNGMLYAPSANAWLYGGYALNNARLTFYGTTSSSFQTNSELAWVLNNDIAGTYNIDFVGNYNGTMTMNVVIDNVMQVVTLTGNGTSGQILGTITQNLTKGVHTISVKANAGLTFNGLNLSYADDVTGYTTTLKASEFALNEGQGDMAGTYGGYYDTTPTKMDAAYYLSAYSPCEFRHPSVNGVIDSTVDEAIMNIDEWMKYDVCVPVEGFYDVSVNVASDAGVKIGVKVASNGNSILASRESTGNWNTLESLNVGKIYLKSGHNSLIFKNTERSIMYLSSLTFAYSKTGYIDLLNSDGEKVDTVSIGSEYTVNAYAKPQDKITLIVAGYDENDSLTTVKLVNGIGTANIDAFAFDAATVDAKIMLWNTLDMEPIINAEAIKVENN